LFQNAYLFRLEDPGVLAPEALEGGLAGHRFQSCGPLQTVSMGWVPPLGETTSALVHAAGDCVLVCARRQERLLPAAVVAEAVDERAQEIEEQATRSVGRRERRQLREQVLLELLPRAFTRSRRVSAYADRRAGWLLVDAASSKAAEELVELLRETLGTLPVRPPRPAIPPELLMTGWLRDGELPPGLALGEECELRDARDERSVVRCRGQDLTGEEIAAHLRAGKQVVKLALDWQGRLALLLQEDLSLKRLRFADELIEEAMEEGREDEAARLDAELVIMSGELRGMLERLDEVFGLSAAEPAEKAAPPPSP
jgi:recombination associated protein RdgC